jgi:large subunit ribosomal protein L25
MAGERVRLEVKEREDCGSRPANRLRRQGFVPGVLYGSGKPRPFYVEERELRQALGGEHGMHAILDVVLDGQQKTHHAVLKDYQLDPVRSALLHVDLHEVRLDRPIQAQVTVELVGDPQGVSMGGLLSQIIRELAVEALPMSIPDRLELDVTRLEIGDQVKVSDIVVPQEVEVLDDADAIVATVTLPRRMELPEEEEPAEEAAEGEEPEAGEAEGAPPEAEAESEAAES